VILPAGAEIEEFPPALLAPGALEGLWPQQAEAISIAEVAALFDGTRVIGVPQEGYVESFSIPKASKEAVEKAVNDAVSSGVLWLLAGQISLWREDVPAGIVTDSSELRPPPAETSATALLPQNLPDAWKGQETVTAAALAEALSVQEGNRLPWHTIKSAIDDALRTRLLERASESGPWPSAWTDAQLVVLQVSAASPAPPPPAGHRYSEAVLTPSELQDFVDVLPEVLKAAAGLELRLVMRLQLGAGAAEPSAEQVAAVNWALGKGIEKLQL
jgi:hypothetical protein